MPSFRLLLLRHGFVFLFIYVLIAQAGLPIPADPLLLIMGALVGDGHYRFFAPLMVAVAAALCGDVFWYEIGRRRGRAVLGLICKLSLEPDTCVRKTELNFRRRGAWTILFAKFVPGMSIVSMALAGAIRMRRWRFLLTDAAGCLLWSSAYLLIGKTLHKQVDSIVIALGLYGRRAGWIVLALLAAYAGFKYLQRWRFYRQLRINRVTPQEALALIANGGAVTVVDLRNPLEIEEGGFKVAGARILRPEDLRSNSHEIPDDHDVILYCS